MIQVTIVKNPFKTTDFEQLNLPYRDGLTMAEVVRNFDLSNKKIKHNRHGIVADHELELYDIKDDDKILIAYKIQGMDPISAIGGGSLLRGVATIGINYLITKEAWRQVKKFMASLHPKVKAPLSSSDNDDLNSSQTYSWDGIQTLSDYGVPVPIIYGSMYVGGNVISAFTTQDGTKSYLNLLLALGEGPVKSIAGSTVDSDNVDIDSIGDLILIDGNPISNYRDARVFVRLGNDVQESISRFNDLRELFDIGDVLLQKSVPYVRSTINFEVDAIQIFFQHASLAEFNRDTGETKETKYRAEVYYKPYGADDSEYILHGVYEKEAKTLSELIGVYTIDGLETGRYDTKIIQKTPNTQLNRYATDTYILRFVEIRDLRLTYPRTALLGITLLATNQISGSAPNIKTFVEGLKVEQISEVGGEVTKDYSDNHIWCLRDLCQNDWYGLGEDLDGSLQSFDELFPLAEYCKEQISIPGTGQTEERFKLSTVIDSEEQAIDTVTRLASSARIYPVWYGGTLQFFIEKLELDIPIFGMGDIKKLTFQQSWRSFNEEIAFLTVEYLDETRGYERKSILVQNTPSLQNRRSTRKDSIFLRTCTRRTEATRIGKYILNVSRYYPRTVTIRCGINAIRVTAGKVFGLAHDVPGYGIVSGRVENGGSNYIILPSKLVVPSLNSGETLDIAVRGSDDLLQVRTLDVMPGQEFEAGEEIPIIGTWTSNPQNYDSFAVGKSGILVKKFRCTQTKQLNNWEMEITATEYPTANEEAFYDGTDEPIMPLQESTLPDPRKLPNYVSLITAYAEPSYYPVVYLSFKAPNLDTNFGFFDHAELYISSDGGLNYVYYGKDNDGSIQVQGLYPNREYKFKFVSVSTQGRKTDFNLSPEIAFTPLPALPMNIHGLQLKDAGLSTIFNSADAHFIWKGVGSRTSTGLGAGQDPNGAGGGARDSFFSHYRVEIYENSVPPPGVKDHIPIRVENVNVEWYKYTLQMNSEDQNPDLPLRNFVIKVYAVDIFNQKSVIPATLKVTNTEPELPESLIAIEANISGGKYYVNLNWDNSVNATATDDVIYEIYYGFDDFTDFTPDNLAYSGGGSFFQHIIDLATFPATDIIVYKMKVKDIYGYADGIVQTSVQF